MVASLGRVQVLFRSRRGSVLCLLTWPILFGRHSLCCECRCTQLGGPPRVWGVLVLVHAYLPILLCSNSRFDAWQLANINQAGWATAPEKAAVLQYGTDFLEQWRAVIRPPNGAMITTCICHACNWTSFVLNGKNSYRHYADWVFGSTSGNNSLHVDMRPPNAGGSWLGHIVQNFLARSRTRIQSQPVPKNKSTESWIMSTR